MADIVPNISLGQVAAMCERVDNADPANARVVVIPLSKNAGALTDEEIRDADTLAAIISAGGVERTTGGWNRKTLGAADFSPLSADDANNRMDIDIADLVWTSVSAGTVDTLLFCFTTVASPTDSDLKPMTSHDFSITPSGGDVTAQIAVFFRATSLN